MISRDYIYVKLVCKQACFNGDIISELRSQPINVIKVQ